MTGMFRVRPKPISAEIFCRISSRITYRMFNGLTFYALHKNVAKLLLCNLLHHVNVWLSFSAFMEPWHFLQPWWPSLTPSSLQDWENLSSWGLPFMSTPMQRTQDLSILSVWTALSIYWSFKPFLSYEYVCDIDCCKKYRYITFLSLQVLGISQESLPAIFFPSIPSTWTRRTSFVVRDCTVWLYESVIPNVW